MKKMSDPLNGFRPKGALLECYMSFLEFRRDLEFLVNEGYIKVTGPETCVWLKSKTSLAEYFRWIGWDAEGISGGFWAPIENAFGIKRHTRVLFVVFLKQKLSLIPKVLMDAYFQYTATYPLPYP